MQCNSSVQIALAELQLLLAAVAFPVLLHVHNEGKLMQVTTAHLRGSWPLCLGSVLWLPSPQSWHQAGRKAGHLHAQYARPCTIRRRHQLEHMSHDGHKQSVVNLLHPHMRLSWLCVVCIHICDSSSARCCCLTWCCASLCGLCVGASLPNAKGDLRPCKVRMQQTLGDMHITRV
jgi:hypothetical protein